MSSSNTLLKGKKVVIIGGSSGIGRGIAAAALSNGASVVIASSNQSKVDAAVELLKKGATKDGATVSGEAVNITDFAALSKFLKKEAPFDHFVSTAGEPPSGFGGSGPSADVDIRDKFKDTLDVRYWAVLNAANIIHKNQLIRPGGSFTMTIGTFQQRPIPGVGFFIGVSGAVETATRALAVDLKPLRVNTISPGFVLTELLDHFPKEVLEPIVESARQKSLVGHVGTPEEVAEAYIFAMK
ncbi:Enoyl-(Acyl carrier protein) reductase [Ceratobasidium sp. AG-Ba]|nr:Enoyl-(Acyl carrier protein) reductase [Ceratobasidium sp. AG-Ba]QRW09424.1 Enoyl-(Acyl carrier protein) reductase [Ceratobasidium sp. AG-Ba]